MRHDEGLHESDEEQRPDRLAEPEHHEISSKQPARVDALLESDADTQQVTDVQQRQLRRVGRLDELVGKLRPHVVQQRVQ